MILDQEFRVESRSSEFRVRVQEFRVQEFRVAMQVPGIQGSESRSSESRNSELPCKFQESRDQSPGVLCTQNEKKQCTQNGNKTMHKKRLNKCTKTIYKLPATMQGKCDGNGKE